MKVLLLADLHFHNFQQFNRGGRTNSRLNYTLRAVESALMYACCNDISEVFILGDIFHSHSKIDVDVLCRVHELFDSFHKQLNLHFLVGNHDQSAKDGSIHSLGMFRGLGEVIDYHKTFHYGEFRVDAVPHTTDMDLWKEWRANIDAWNPDLFLFHQGLNEGQIGAFNISLKGSLSLSDLPRAKVRAGGHYHKNQFLDDHTLYVGSPIQHNFGERGEVKGWCVVDLETGEVEHIPNVASPKFFQFGSVEEFEESGVNADYNYVRIVTDSNADISIPGVQVIYTSKNKATDVRYQPETINDAELIREYVSRTNSELDVEKLLQMGDTLLTEAEQ